ncbi:hypothetical protein ES703_100080 [subsurface metagenome]
MDVVGGAVQGVDDPAVGGRGGLVVPKGSPGGIPFRDIWIVPLLGYDGVVREGPAQGGDDRFFTGQVRLGDQVHYPLLFHPLQALELIHEDGSRPPSGAQGGLKDAVKVRRWGAYRHKARGGQVVA